MGKKTSARSSSIFLLELIVSILFFSIAGAVCTQVFVKAHSLSVEAQQLAEAVGICSNCAELVRAAQSPEEADLLLMEEYNFIEENDRKLTVAYIEKGLLRLNKSEEDGLYIYDFSYEDDQKRPVYSLQLKRFFKGVRAS